MHKLIPSIIASLLLTGALAPMASAEAALEKLKTAKEADFSSTGHHEHQQAKEAHKSGDFKKCADQASKALEHLKKG